MARDFTKNVANYMTLGVNALGPLLNGASQISVHHFVYHDTLPSGSASGSDTIHIQINGSTTGIILFTAVTGATHYFRCQARSVSTDTSRFLDTATAAYTGALISFGCVFDFASDNIRIYLNGVQDASGISGTWANATYTNGTPTLTDAIGCAVSGGTPISTDRQTDGRISEVAIWTSDIGSAGFAALASRIAAPLISPESLKFYLPLLGFDSPERDHWGGLSGTITGTVSAADHPNIIYPAGVINVQKATAASSVTGRLIGGRLIGGHLTRSRLVGI